MRSYNPNVIPPGGFAFIEPETKAIIRGDTFDKLVDAVRRYRAQAGVEYSTTYYDVVEHLCATNPKGCVENNALQTRAEARAERVEAAEPELARDIASWIAAKAKALHSHVTRKEALARAEMCLKCPHNDAVQALFDVPGGRARAEQIMLALKADKRTPADPKLGFCRLHREHTRLSVWLYRQGEPKDTTFQPCWRSQDTK